MDDGFVKMITDADVHLEYRIKRLYQHATQDKQYHYLTPCHIKTSVGRQQILKNN